ncbi:hypothetical protein D9M70_618870 [compost metagenome]
MGIAAAHQAELARQVQAVTLATQGPSEQFFVGMRPVHVGGVEQRHAQLHGAVQRGNRFALVHAGGVEVRHAHAAQADGGNVRAVMAELASLHADSSWK